MTAVDDFSLDCCFSSEDALFDAILPESMLLGAVDVLDDSAMIALPAIVLSSPQRVSKRKRVEARLRWVREIYAKDRKKLVTALIRWFGDHGYTLQSHAAPHDSAAQLGYHSAAFLDSKDARVAVLHREFPVPVLGCTIRLFDRVGHFPVVFVSSADGIVDQIKVTSVEHWEDHARRFLPQFDAEAEEVSTLKGVVSFKRPV